MIGMILIVADLLLVALGIVADLLLVALGIVADLLLVAMGINLIGQFGHQAAMKEEPLRPLVVDRKYYQT